MTETINGLHKCKAKNTPVEGEVKNMVVEHKPPRNGKKAWIKITNKSPEDGGSPYRILGVQKLDWPPDEHQNIAFNIEVEASSSPPSAFQQTKAAMRPDLRPPETVFTHGTDAERGIPIAPQSPPHAQQAEDGVTEARKHLMQSCNLLNLCIAAVNKAIAPNVPEIAQTSEFFQAQVATLFIEASSRRTTDGVNWWSFIDRMPTTPLALNGKHAATAKPIHEIELENQGEVPF